MGPYDLSTLSQGLTPEDQQRIKAEVLRRQQQGDLLRQANEQGNRFNTMAAVAQMANNPSAAAAAKLAMENAQKQYKPVQMGNQGFALPGTGDFVSSPMYEDEQNAARQARKDQLRDTLAQREESSREGRLLRESLAAQSDATRREMAQERNALMLTLKGMGIESSERIAQMLIEGRKDVAAAKGKTGKTLPASEVRRLTDLQAVPDTFGEIIDGFKDEYSAGPVVTKGQNMVGQYFDMGYGNQSNWWKNYNEQKNITRHKLFGSALTATEKKEFDAANIVEGMDPAQIRTKLAQQRRAAAKAAAKLTANLGKAGYDMSAFETEAIPDAPIPGGGARPAAPDDDALVNKYLNIQGLSR